MLLRLVKKELGERLFRKAARRAPPICERRHGSWHHADLEWMARIAKDVPGEFGEIGVFRGAAFSMLVALAGNQGRTAHAFDSFRGMGEPGPQDGEQYPQGKFNVGGADAFAGLMDQAGIERGHYRLWPGYIPTCFEAFPPHLRFALMIIDVDHYQPTADSLLWAVPRLNRGSILALDDYVPKFDNLASKAIKEFLARQPPFETIAEFNQQLILRKK